MRLDIDKLSIEELEQQSRELAVEREKARAESDKAHKHYLTVTERQNIIDQILSFRKKQLEESDPMVSLSENVNETDKTTAILEFVQRRGTEGVYPKEVEAALRESGIELKDGYVHAILSRLKKRGEVMTRGKRYFSTGSKTANAGQ
jgi:hypothetical protein